MNGFTLFALGSEQTLKDYCTPRGIVQSEFPDEIEREDSRNKKYHFVYEQDLYGYIERTQVILPFIVLFGSGAYHHITHALLKKLVDKTHDGYTVVLIDNHSDCEDIGIQHTGGDYPLNCATHMRESLRKCNLLEVIHLYKKTQAGADWYDKKLIKKGYVEVVGDRPPQNITPEFVQSILDSIFDEVYLSIDIDALSKEELDVESYQQYDQGTMTLTELLLIVKMLKEQKKLIGVDICGMTRDSKSARIYDALIKIFKEEGERC